MLRDIRALQSALGIDPAGLLLMAREAAGDSRLRCVEDLTDGGLRALLMDLRAMSGPLLLAA